LGFKGGDVGARYFPASPCHPLFSHICSPSSMQRSAAPTRLNTSRAMTFINLFCIVWSV
jgi:hypothetical protein